MLYGNSLHALQMKREQKVNSNHIRNDYNYNSGGDSDHKKGDDLYYIGYQMKINW